MILTVRIIGQGSQPTISFVDVPCMRIREILTKRYGVPGRLWISDKDPAHGTWTTMRRAPWQEQEQQQENAQ